MRALAEIRTDLTALETEREAIAAKQAALEKAMPFRGPSVIRAEFEALWARTAALEADTEALKEELRGL